ncbi:hypothetical protein NAP1_15513 [Erythrobacter sp. NAP1]|nr:hypothetical protein NAP1_15513 [Erythrobacter sp. NAP1]
MSDLQTFSLFFLSMAIPLEFSIGEQLAVM